MKVFRVKFKGKYCHDCPFGVPDPNDNYACNLINFGFVWNAVRAIGKDGPLDCPFLTHDKVDVIASDIRKNV